MRYRSSADFAHEGPDRTGVLLVHLGTPAAPERGPVRRFLGEFLSDPRVVELPRALWQPLLHLVILNTRPQRSAAAYARVWSEEGSPLLAIARRQRDALAQRLAAQTEATLPVALGMRYGEPSIAMALDELAQAGVRRLLVLPLYPQYSATTTGSVFDAVSTELARWRWLPEFRFVTHYHDDQAYIAALAGSVRAHQSVHGEPDLLLMSFHGIPQAYFDAGDPYYCECRKTARLLADTLELTPARQRVSFQSRMGPKRWLQPYTDHTLRVLPKEGVKQVQVICPGFSADCLETLDEIAVENRHLFLKSGGERYEYIPALNDSEAHIAALADIVLRHTQGWCLDSGEAPALRALRARSAGATG